MNKRYYVCTTSLFELFLKYRRATPGIALEMQLKLKDSDIYIIQFTYTSILCMYVYVFLCFLIYIYIYIYIHIIYIHIHIIMKIVCPPSYHHNNFVATHSLGQPYIMFPSVYVYMYVYMYVLYMYIYIYIYVYSTVSWPAVHEHIAADVFRYKRNFVSHYYICGYNHV